MIVIGHKTIATYNNKETNIARQANNRFDKGKTEIDQCYEMDSFVTHAIRAMLKL